MHAPLQRTLRAHAKVNLRLRVLAREASGYHGIETLFQRIALSDIVHLSLHAGGRTLSCDGPAMPADGFGPPESNLAWRAAALYADAARWDTGWDIAIEKHIPVGGGLGGGSADAGAVLRAMAAMHAASAAATSAPLGREALLELAGALGSDVPFMVCDAPLALAWNRGDRLLPIASLPRMAVTLVAFTEGVHTGDAYGRVASLRTDNNGGRAGAAAFAAAFALDQFRDWASVAQVAVNDFEPAVRAMHAGVAAVLPVLQSEAARLRASGGVAIGMLSGSGATCYLLHEPDADVRLALPAGSVIATHTV